LKVDININDGEFTAHFDEVAKITIERRIGLKGKIQAVETIEDLEIWYKVEQI